MPELFLFWDRGWAEVGKEWEATYVSHSQVWVCSHQYHCKRSFPAHSSWQQYRSQTSTSLAPAQIMDIIMVSSSNMHQRHQHVFSNQPGLQTTDLNTAFQWQHRPQTSAWPLHGGGGKESSINHRHQSFVETWSKTWTILHLSYLVVKSQGYRAVGQCVWSRTCMSSRLCIILPSMLADTRVIQAQPLCLQPSGSAEVPRSPWKFAETSRTDVKPPGHLCSNVTRISSRRQTLPGSTASHFFSPTPEDPVCVWFISSTGCDWTECCSLFSDKDD